METKTNRFSLLIGLALILLPNAASAQVVITEIMYDLPSGSDSGREWIEVYNVAPTAVDLTKLRLFENGTNHKIAAVADASALPPATYAVIADDPSKFKSDWPSFGSQLFDSAFSLSNDGETIALNNASSTALDTVSYTSALGAAGDGNSLNREPGNTLFSSHTPSPGAPMSSGVSAPKAKPIPVPKIVPQKKTTTSKPADTTVVDYPAATSGVPDVANAQVAAAAASTAMPVYEWWLAAGALALASAGAIVLARRYAKDEWNIVEDTSE